MAYDPLQFVLAVEGLRPVKNIIDFLASDHGEGPYISAWYPTDITQPTQEEIESVDTDALLYQQNMPVLSAKQFRLGLLDVDLLDDAETAVAAAGRDVQVTWEYGVVVQRHDPMTEAIQAALGLTDEFMDALFYQATAL
jgi:hypothetical protein